MERYYPKIDNGGFCTEYCRVKVGWAIGSVACQGCENCTDYDKKDQNWINCKIIEKAK